MTCAAPPDLAAAIDALLPQTQCRRCGYPDCHGYAAAIATGEAEIDRCPPGGAEGIARLAALTGRALLPLNPANGVEGPLRLAQIDEDGCIGCTLCIQACPMDCIVGAARQMHTVVGADCSGCELCVAACPVDCIAMIPVSGEHSGWAAWSPAQAQAARRRYALQRERREREQREADARLASNAHARIAALAARSDTAGGSVADAREHAPRAARHQFQELAGERDRAATGARSTPPVEPTGIDA